MRTRSFAAIAACLALAGRNGPKMELDLLAAIGPKSEGRL